MSMQSIESGEMERSRVRAGGAKPPAEVIRVHAPATGQLLGEARVTSPDEVPASTDGDELADDAAARARANARAAAQAGLVKGRPLLGSVNVRKYDELNAGGRLFWKISRSADEWLPASAIREHTPSPYQGTRLGDDTGLTLPMAFVWPRGGAAKAWTRGAVKGGGTQRQPIGRVAGRERVRVRGGAGLCK